MDPVSMAVGAGLVSLGMFIGWVIGARSRVDGGVGGNRVLPICACEHPYGAHLDGGECQEDVERPHYNEYGSRNGFEYVDCVCAKYTGPEPLSSDIWVPPMLPTTEADR